MVSWGRGSPQREGDGDDALVGDEERATDLEGVNDNVDEDAASVADGDADVDRDTEALLL